MGQVLIVTTNYDEALKTYREYRESTGKYAALRIRAIPEGQEDNLVLVVAYDEPCVMEEKFGLSHGDLRVLATHYLRLVKLKVQTERLIRYVHSEAIRNALAEALEEKDRLRKLIEVVERHPVYSWCRGVAAGRGRLGQVEALLFLGFIDPHEATTAGKVFSYWGLTPEGKLVAGVKAKGRIELKGRAMFTAKRVVMGKDPYYYPLFKAKKEYYESKDEIVVKSGSREMVYRRGAKGYSALCNSKALYWLAKLLLSHAWEVLRESEGLLISRHRMHIPPKPEDWENMKSSPDWYNAVLEAVKVGEVITFK